MNKLCDKNLVNQGGRRRLRVGERWMMIRAYNRRLAACLSVPLLEQTSASKAYTVTRMFSFVHSQVNPSPPPSFQHFVPQKQPT